MSIKYLDKLLPSKVFLEFTEAIFTSKINENMVSGKLSIIMPGFNEGEHIYDNLLVVCNEICKFCTSFEVLYVDDGSTDDSVTMAQKAANEDARIKVILAQTNEGKGAALRLGTANANGDYIAFLDSDLDLPPAQLRNFFKIMQEQNADAVIGSKMHPDSKLEYPLIRRIFSSGYHFLIRILFRLKLHDTQTGIKLFKAAAIKPIMKKILVKRFAFDIEILALCNRKQMVIAEAPIELVFTRNNQLGRIKIKDIFNIAWDSLAVFYRLNIIKYYRD